MSVEEARAAIHKHCDLADFAYLNPGMDAALKHQESTIDRLILEVQAEMPCCKNDVFCCHEERRDEHCGPYCPSCTARMKLKETSDAR